MLEVEAFLVDRKGWEWGEEEGQKEREEEKHFRSVVSQTGFVQQLEELGGNLIGVLSLVLKFC